MNQPSVAIVILNYNGRNYLEKFLPIVLQSTYINKRVIVADNASSDDSVALVNEKFPGAELVLLDRNYGFADGYNHALKQVQSDYFVLLNSDVEVTAGWIEPVIAHMERNTGIAACQPKILSYHQKDHFEYAGAAGGWIDTLGYPFSRGRIFDICERDNGQYNNIENIFWASGAAMFIRPHIFFEAGGFDPFFFAHMEEIDLCWRIQLAGYKIACVPASVVYHVGGGTLPKGNMRKVFLNFRNNLIMLCKNMPVREKIWKLPFRILLDAIFAWKSLLGGFGESFTAVLKAHLSVVKWCVVQQKKRIKFKRQPMTTMGTVYKGLVIWKHFAEKKTRFSEIVKKNL